MVKRYVGGVISAVPVSITTFGAQGMFTPVTAAQYTQSGVWPVAGGHQITDPNGIITYYSSLIGLSFNTPGEWTIFCAGNTVAILKAWGAGGGSSTFANGGVGGYATGTFTFQVAATYKIWVGGGGRTGNSSINGYDGGFGGGGLAGKTNSASTKVGSGGGLTGLFLTSATQSNAILIAGGGGGGCTSGSSPGTTGGFGGGTNGSVGTASGNGGAGGGGTQSAGGDAGTTASYPSGSTGGSALTGGLGATTTTTNYSGAGGGGGYFGGGGGGGNNTQGGSGGGGSGYLHPTLITNGSFTTGSKGASQSAPNNGDSSYINSAGTAATTTAGATAPAGLFVIT